MGCKPVSISLNFDYISMYQMPEAHCNLRAVDQSCGVCLVVMIHFFFASIFFSFVFNVCINMRKMFFTFDGTLHWFWFCYSVPVLFFCTKLTVIKMNSNAIVCFAFIFTWPSFALNSYDSFILRDDYMSILLTISNLQHILSAAFICMHFTALTICFFLFSSLY